MIPVAAQVGSFAMANAGWISAISAGLGALGTYQQGQVAKQIAKAQSEDLKVQAANERAASHYEMAKQRREAKARAGETRVALSSSGFGGDDTLAAHIIGETAKEETLQELMTKALAEQRAKNMERNAQQTLWEGKQTAKAATISAFGQIVGGAASWAERYNPQPANASKPKLAKAG